MIAKEQEAWEVYHEATAPARKVYDETLAQAREAKND